MPRQPNFSPALRSAVCQHLTAQLSNEQLDQLDRGEHVQFQRGCRGDPAIDEAIRLFKRGMRSDARAQTITRKQFMKIAFTWMQTFNSQGADAMEDVRPKRTRLSQTEWDEAAEILCAPVEHNDGWRYWRSAADCLEEIHSGQGRFR